MMVLAALGEIRGDRNLMPVEWALAPETRGLLIHLGAGLKPRDLISGDTVRGPVQRERTGLHLEDGLRIGMDGYGLAILSSTGTAPRSPLMHKIWEISSLSKSIHQLVDMEDPKGHVLNRTEGSWIVRPSVGSSACLLGKAVDLTYIRGERYLEIDVDIGSSTIANGVLGLVIGVITSLVVDLAFLIQSGFARNTYRKDQIDVIQAEWVDEATPYIKAYVPNM